MRGIDKKNLASAKGLMLALVFAAISAEAQNRSAAAPRRQVVVSIVHRKLALLEDGQVRKVYAVAVGASATPSPAGKFTVTSRVVKPTYYHEGVVIPPGPGNPVGTRWMGLSHKGYGIHGTNAPHSIGKAASHGCIRMAQSDLEELFELMSVGDEVEIRDQADPETAALFAPGPIAGTDTAAPGQ